MKSKIISILKKMSRLFVLWCYFVAALNSSEAQNLASPRIEEYCEIKGLFNVEPKLDNELMKSANDILSKQVDPMSFYFYSGPVSAYGLKKLKVGGAITTEMVQKSNANIFLTLLCGEFRDNPKMIKAKLEWITKLYKLPVKTDNTFTYNPSKPVWSQLTANTYAPYIKITNEIFNARLQEVQDLNFGLKENEAADGITTATTPVEGMTVCETKFIFENFVSKGKDTINNNDSLDNAYKDYMKEYVTYSKNPNKCKNEDLDYYYDFRGDSNFKPNSPEANGMIWYSNSILSNCVNGNVKLNGSSNNKSSADTSTDVPKFINLEEKKKIISDEACASYISQPYASRYNAAKAGLASWLLRGKDQDTIFSDTNKMVAVVPNLLESVISKLTPFPYSLKLKELVLIKDFLNMDLSKSDLGMEDLLKSGRPLYDLNNKYRYMRLRDAVNRHTDWYDAGWNDQLSAPKDQAYSPFVASSYEMSKSDGFAQPGVTVSSPSDGRKHWMFIFKVHKDNWYNSQSAKEGKMLNFDTQWFDETSLGTNRLAKTERAWDRLGTPKEEELDSILYLHNVTTYHEANLDEIDQSANK